MNDTNIEFSDTHDRKIKDRISDLTQSMLGAGLGTYSGYCAFGSYMSNEPSMTYAAGSMLGLSILAAGYAKKSDSSIKDIMMDTYLKIRNSC